MANIDLVGAEFIPRVPGAGYRAAVSAAGIRGIQTIAISFRAAIVRTVEVLQQEVPPELREIGLAFTPDRNRRLYQETHDDLAARARAAMVERFNRSTTTGPYRQGQNRLSGVLEPLLGSESMNTSTPFRISFINIELLDAQARHWRRLNFGAEPRGSAPGRFTATIGGQPFTIGFPPGFGPSGPVLIPRGVWANPGGPPPTFAPNPGARGSHAFFPRKKEFSVTRGIEAKHFADAGFERLAAEVGPAYRQLFDDIKRKVESESGTQRVRVQV